MKRVNGKELMMMDDKERYQQLDKIHMFIAIRRTKDNTENCNAKKIHRRLIYNEEYDLEIIKRQCEAEGDIWRIYHTVNARDIQKALNRKDDKKNFRHIMVDTLRTDIESLWRKELLQRYNRGEKKYMLDIDAKDTKILDECKQLVGDNFLNLYPSPNGYHMVIKPTDVRLFEDVADVTVLKDGYYHVTTVGKKNE